MVAPNDTPVETVAPVVAEEKTTEKVVKAVEEKIVEPVAEEKVTDEPVAEEAPEMTKEETLAKANELLEEGKIAYTKTGFEVAQDKFSECCELISGIEGGKSASLYTPMLYLAKTLLALARLEQPVIANALTGVEETADDSTVEDETTKEDKIDKDVVDEKQMDEVAEKVIEALDENAAEADAAKNGEKVDKETEETTDKKEEVAEEKMEEPVEGEKCAETSEGAEGEAGDDDDAESTATEDITNIQLAYENAATARLIAGIELEKAADAEKGAWKEKVAEALLVLAKVCIADDEFEKALIELVECEKVQTDIWSKSDRRIAETHFEFGRAYTELGRFPEATEVYGKASEVLTTLKNETAAKLESATDEAEKAKITEEVTNLEQLLKDVECWVKDSIDSHKSRVEASEETKKDEAAVGAVGTSTDKETPANDISGLVRKRKADEPSKEEEKMEQPTAVTGNSPAKENTAVEDEAVNAKKARLSSETNEATGKDVPAQ